MGHSISFAHVTTPSDNSSVHSESAVLAAGPELDMATAPQLGIAVLDHLARGDRTLVVDFAAVRLIDSAGIGVLLSADRRVRAAGGQMFVSNANDHVRRVFELAGVDRSLSLL